MSAGEQKKSCEEIAELLMFYACDELQEQERSKVEEHVAVVPPHQLFKRWTAARLRLFHENALFQAG